MRRAAPWVVLLAALAGCSAPAPPEPTAPSASRPGDVPVRVTALAASPLADAPSAVLVHVETEPGGAPVAAAAVDVVEGGEGLVQHVAPGRYRLRVEQRECAPGEDVPLSCPADAGSGAYAPVPVWACATTVEARAGQEVRVRAVGGPDAGRTDDAECLTDG
ncbi:hypothetical protein [Kineococcus terrestris]|uniref:hypothetical protein n=1 Tax=Kineococcus terrestris TaxID=2044856 RepID=UPI0034DAFF65